MALALSPSIAQSLLPPLAHYVYGGVVLAPFICIVKGHKLLLVHSVAHGQPLNSSFNTLRPLPVLDYLATDRKDKSSAQIEISQHPMEHLKRTPKATNLPPRRSVDIQPIKLGKVCRWGYTRRTTLCRNKAQWSNR